MVYHDARETADTSLEKLAAELAARGFETRLTAPDGRVPSLAVTNREAAMLTETVLADATSFWWPWADRIAALTDVGTAADTIARVLGDGFRGQPCMTGDDTPSLTALLCEFGGLWVIARTPRGFTAQRRPLPAPPVVLATATVAALRELLEHGYDTGKLAELMRDYGAEWDIERLDPGSTWVAVSRDGALTRVITAGDLDSLRSKLGGPCEGPGEDSPG